MRHETENAGALGRFFRGKKTADRIGLPLGGPIRRVEGLLSLDATSMGVPETDAYDSGTLLIRKPFIDTALSSLGWVALFATPTVLPEAAVWMGPAGVWYFLLAFVTSPIAALRYSSGILDIASGEHVLIGIDPKSKELLVRIGRNRKKLEAMDPEVRGEKIASELRSAFAMIVEWSREIPDFGRHYRYVCMNRFEFDRTESARKEMTALGKIEPPSEKKRDRWKTRVRIPRGGDIEKKEA